jgi:hypothetical protein
MLMIVTSSVSPALAGCSRARPARRASSCLGLFWVRQAPCDHRESARWSISLHYRIASLQGRIAVDWSGICGLLPESSAHGGRCGTVCGRWGDTYAAVCCNVFGARACSQGPCGAASLRTQPRAERCIFGCNCLSALLLSRKRDSDGRGTALLWHFHGRIMVASWTDGGPSADPLRCQECVPPEGLRGDNQDECKPLIVRG